MAKVSKDQVMAYLCGLTNECGPNPNIAQAAVYSSSHQSAVTPADAVMALGVQDWDGVMAAYGRYITTGYIATGSKPTQDGANSPSFSPVHVEKRHRKTYDDEEILAALKQTYAALGGQCTQVKVNAYAKEHHTPTYASFVKRFGSNRNWAAIVNEAECNNQPTEQRESIGQEPTIAKEQERFARDAKTETKTTKSPILTEETSPKTIIELKISVPGLLDPITMEIAIK